jgi:hypothetical protein
MYNPLLVSSLKKCQTEEQVEAAFRRFHQVDNGAKIKYLNICRGNPTKTFFAGAAEKGDEAELRSQYLTVRSMFLTGSWR